MNFIKAEKKDIPTIQNLARKSWESAYADILSKEQIEYMLGTMYAESEIFSHLENPNYHYYLIENNGEVAGFIGYEHHYEPKTTKLHRIYLLPESKGKGLGKAGISFLKDKVAEVDDNRIILNVNKSNKAKIVYEKQGFTVYDNIVLDIGNDYVMDDYLMEYVL